MKLLLVDANPTSREACRKGLSEQGIAVLAAPSGEQALRQYPDTRFDAVCCAASLPCDANWIPERAFAEVPALAALPQVLLADAVDEATRLHALAKGLDAVFVHPLVYGDAAAALRRLVEKADRVRHAETQANHLAAYQASEAENLRIARHLLDRLVNAGQLDDPALQYWILPASSIAGDIVAAARTPAGVLHLMLADGPGHGLAALINNLPIAAPFYSMTEKGFAIDSIARELNAKARLVLPRDRFVAVALISVDFREGLIRLWNGGLPKPRVLDGSGQVVYVFGDAHLPLGVLADEEFDSIPESHAYLSPVRLVAFSDGLLHLCGPESLSEQRVVAALSSTEADTLAGIQELVSGRLLGSAPRDDIAVALVSCDTRRADDVMSNPTQGHADGAMVQAFEPQGRSTWRFSLRLGASDLRRLDVVPILLNLANQFEEVKSISGELFVLLSEFFNNALDHGLLRLDSTLKLGADGIGTYLDQRAARLAALETGEIALELECRAGSPRGTLKLVCRDSGPGFDHQTVVTSDSPEVSELPFGRGLTLARQLCETVIFNAAGNEVTATLAIPPTTPRPV